MYVLIFDTKAMKLLEKLPKNISQRIFTKLRETKNNPHRYFIRLTNRSEYKLRVGSYRIIADIMDNELRILILYIKKRSRVYN